MEEERIIGFFKVNKTKSLALVKNYLTKKSGDKEILSKNFVEYYCLDRKRCLTKYMMSSTELYEAMDNWIRLTKDEVDKLKIDFSSEALEGFTDFTRKEDNVMSNYTSFINRCEKEIRQRNYEELAILIGYKEHKLLKNPEAEQLGLHTTFQKGIEKSLNVTKPDFVAIDFEHSTSFKGSICSVGIVSFKDGNIIDEYYSLVQPPNNEYNWYNSKVNHITSKDTIDSPTFDKVYPEIKKRIDGNILIAHGAKSTDKPCLLRAMEVNNIPINLNIEWKCTYEIYGCSLNVACEVCDIELDHHQALSDARACGILYNRYLNSDIPHELIDKVKSKQQKKTKFDFDSEILKGEVLKPDFEHVENMDNPFYKKKVVLTGFSKEGGVKIIIANELKKLGGDVDTSIGKKTNFLITGQLSAGPSKLKKMQANIDEGKEAQILTHEDYKMIISKFKNQ